MSWYTLVVDEPLLFYAFKRSNTMTIRLAIQKDLSALTSIYNEAILRQTCTADTEVFTVEKRQAFLDAHQNDLYPLYVYEVDNKAVGYVYFSAYRPGRKAMIKTAEISYYIANDYQGQGIGSTLLAFALEEAKRLGFKTLVAILLGVNKPSIGLLEKFGFEKWGCLPSIAEFDYGMSDHLYYGLKLED